MFTENEYGYECNVLLLLISTDGAEWKYQEGTQYHYERSTLKVYYIAKPVGNSEDGMWYILQICYWGNLGPTLDAWVKIVGNYIRW